MTGSSRSTTTLAEALRAPYAAPQPVSPTRPHSDANARSAGRQSLAPFVPREYRDLLGRDVTSVPAASHPHVAESVAVLPISAPDWNVDEVSAHFGAAFEVEEADELVSPEEPLNVLQTEPGSGSPEVAAELPWIEAFAEDDVEAEESWPLGEAGRRLDELTESLSSLDGSRARNDATAAGSDQGTSIAGEAPLPMWNEDEWIDIMPTSPAFVQPSQAATFTDLPVASAGTSAPVFEPRVNAAETSGAEFTARALESLAQRIRAGEVQVPDAQPQVAQEALLAGVLASMLGWRQ